MNPLIERARELDALSASLQQLSDGPLMADLIARYRTLCLDLADLVEQQDKEIGEQSDLEAEHCPMGLSWLETLLACRRERDAADSKLFALKADREAVCEWTRPGGGFRQTECGKIIADAEGTTRPCWCGRKVAIK